MPGESGPAPDVIREDEAANVLAVHPEHAPAQGVKTCAFQVTPASEETNSFASGMAPSTTTPWVGSVNPRSLRGAPPPVSV